MRKLAFVFVVLGMMVPFASTLGAQELQEGKWSGTRVQPNGNVQNITFEVKRIPDPHARWRLGPVVILTATIAVGQNKVPLKDILLDGESLSYAFIQPNRAEFRCSLMRQKDGSFTGKCTRMDNAEVAQITMVPPKE
jgi:hypothetical protein